MAGDSVSYSAGFPLGSADTADPVALRDEAVAAASAAEVAVLFLGVPAEEESEGFENITLIVCNEDAVGHDGSRGLCGFGVV